MNDEATNQSSAIGNVGSTLTSRHLSQTDKVEINIDLDTLPPSDDKEKKALNDMKRIKLELQQALEESQGSFLWELAGGVAEFNDPVEFLKLKSLHVQPGLNDILLAEVTQLGHRDKFPRPYDWENLLPTLELNEELLWIAQKRGNAYKLYIGIKFNLEEIKELETIEKRKNRFKILCGNFSRRAFPETLMNKEDANDSAEKLEQFASFNNVFCVLGMPSYKTPKEDEIIAERNEESRPFASINDILESHLNIDEDFSIVFTVSPAPFDDIKESFGKKFAIRNKIKPLIEQTFSNNYGKSSGKNSSNTKTTSEITIQHTTTVQEKENIFDSLGRGAKNLIFGGEGLPSSSDTKITPGKSKTEQEGNHNDSSYSVTMQYTVSNTELNFLDNRLEDSIKHLQQTSGTGGYYSAVMVYAPSAELGLSLSRTLRATLSGSHSSLHPIQIFPITGATDFQLRNIPLHTILQAHRFYPEILNCEKACLSLLLPDTDFPGIKLKKNVFYGRPECIHTDENGVQLGGISYFRDPIREKKIDMPPDAILTMDSKELCSHMFIVGTTGSGKTERAASLLNTTSDDVRIVVLETAKKTYRNMLHRTPLVYTLGNSQLRPFRINPFFFESGTSLKQHIAVLADAIADLLPMEALIGPKLREAVENCYSSCGWDIETNEFLYHSESPTYPDMIMFNNEVHKICQSLSDYGDEVKANYRGALLNRSRIFIDDIYQDIFAYGGNKKIDEMFPPDKDIVIEMEEMPPSEINMPAFIISILLHRVRAKQTMELQLKQPHNYKKFLLVIEEAHNVLNRKFEEKSDEKQSGKGGHLVNQAVRLLAEGRGLGIGIIVIDQSANTIAPSVISNTNTKIIFRQEDGEEIKTIGTAIGLQEDDWNDLQKLETGECIVKSKNSSKPTKLAPLSITSNNEQHSNETLFGDEKICAPYSRGFRLLSKLFNQYFFTSNECKHTVKKLLEMCNEDIAVAKYIVGKYFLLTKQYGLLELTPEIVQADDIKKILLLATPDNCNCLMVLNLLAATINHRRLPDNFGKTNESLNLRKGVQRFCECMMSNIAPPFLDDINYHSICIKLCKCLNSFAEHCISGNKKGYLFDIERVREYLSKYPFLHDAIKIPMLPLDQEDLILKNKNRKERMLW